MLPLLKLVLFLIVLAIVALLGFWCYKKLNEKIIGSGTMKMLLFYSLLLIAAGIVLIFGGMYILIFLYDFLSASTR